MLLESNDFLPTVVKCNCFIIAMGTRWHVEVSEMVGVLWHMQTGLKEPEKDVYWLFASIKEY